MPKVARSCPVCDKPFWIRESELKRGRGRYCSFSCSNRARAAKTTEIVPTFSNQVETSFEIPLEPYNFVISKLRNGVVIVLSDIPYEKATPCAAAVLKAMEQLILAHHVAGLDVLDRFYIKGLKDILDVVSFTSVAESWGWDTNE